MKHGSWGQIKQSKPPREKQANKDPKEKEINHAIKNLKGKGSKKLLYDIFHHFLTLVFEFLSSQNRCFRVFIHLLSHFKSYDVFQGKYAITNTKRISRVSFHLALIWSRSDKWSTSHTNFNEDIFSWKQPSDTPFRQNRPMAETIFQYPEFSCAQICWKLPSSIPLA